MSKFDPLQYLGNPLRFYAGAELEEHKEKLIREVEEWAPYYMHRDYIPSSDDLRRFCAFQFKYMYTRKLSCIHEQSFVNLRYMQDLILDREDFEKRADEYVIKEIAERELLKELEEEAMRKAALADPASLVKSYTPGEPDIEGFKAELVGSVGVDTSDLESFIKGEL